ncbi:YjgN family protein [Aestuariivirga litoralis]|uniref:YjgN family protein n=1 Tax=Aestuariivirga litoralis TaxID=2650924 RepID=UPI0018C6433E|nr:DUF898 family protein [Aestuariivirga litoralis]MBG1231647.1 DUF898 domain-containing protein [Aestuariivirga litoralis]
MSDSETLPPQAPAEQLTFSYVSRPGLLKITLINLVFNILTLSIYRFWGKTNARRHIWSCIHINGEPLEYTGTGAELFRGFLFVFGLIILPFLLLTTGLHIAYGDESPAAAAASAIFGIFVYSMIGFAIYKARRYQLSRTLWRGIRGNLAGSAMTYSLLYFGSMVAKGASLGWATPVMNTVLQEHITNDMRFGDAAFKFKGPAGPLYPAYALCWFLFAVILFVSIAVIGGILAGIYSTIDGTSSQKDFAMLGIGIVFFALAFLCYMVIFPAIWSIYWAKQIRTFAEYTRFDGAQFKLNATAGSLIGLTVVNFLILIFTLGTFWPFILQRNFRYMASRLKLEGAIEVERIRQSSLAVPKRGEGLADAFDVGAW